MYFCDAALTDAPPPPPSTLLFLTLSVTLINIDKYTLKTLKYVAYKHLILC